MSYQRVTVAGRMKVSVSEYEDGDAVQYKEISRTNTKNMTYKTTIYFDIAQMYSKKNCKKCHGRGYLKFITPAPDSHDHYAYCSCSEKNIKKYG